MEWIHRADLGREDRQMKRTRPPKFAARILSLLSSSKKIGILGDTEEEYRMIRSEKSRFKADIWYIWQIFKPMPFFIRSTVYWSCEMFKNYLKIALRNIRRHRGYSFINIAGLAVGIACCLLIFSWARFELSYERFHTTAQEIYRVISEFHSPGGEINYTLTSQAPLAAALKENYPEIINSARGL